MENIYSLLFFIFLLIQHIRSDQLERVIVSDINNLFNYQKSQHVNIEKSVFRSKYENGFLLVMIYLGMLDCSYYLAKAGYFSPENEKNASIKLIDFFFLIKKN